MSSPAPRTTCLQPDQSRPIPSQDDDDDDEIIEEHMDVPAMKPRGKREQVMATNFEVPKDFSPPVHPKSEEETNFLKEVMQSNRLMKSLTPSDRDLLIKAFKKACRTPSRSPRGELLRYM